MPAPSRTPGRLGRGYASGMRHLLLAAVLLAACSSDPEIVTVTADAEPDTRVACGAIGEAVACICETGPGLGRCNADGGVSPCVCLPSDAGPPDADAASDAPADAPADVTEASVDAGPPSVQEALCRAGGPRLSWSGAACIDAGEVSIVGPFACRFRYARDGKVRCLPAATASVAGYLEGTCGVALTTWTGDTIPRYLTVDGAPVETSSVTVTTWFTKGTTCAIQSAAYPYRNAANASAAIKAMLADGAFYAAVGFP